MTGQLVLATQEGAVGRVTLNRPERLNALTFPMREAIAAAFDSFGRDPAIRCVILDAAGRGFCASGDTSGMGAFTAESGRDRLKSAHRMITAIATIEKPVIAAVRGPVAGIGWSMALAADMVVASETAVFSQVFRHVGLVPDGGAIYFLTQALGVQRAKELVYTGRKMLAAGGRVPRADHPACPGRTTRDGGCRLSARAGARPDLRPRHRQEDVQVGEYALARSLPGRRGLGAGPDLDNRGPCRGHQGLHRKAQADLLRPLTRKPA